MMAWYDWIQAFKDFAAIQQQLKAITAQLTTITIQLGQGGSNLKPELDQILSFVDGQRPATRVRIDTGRTAILNKQGKLLMSGTVTVTTDHDAKVPLVWKDDVGGVSAPAASGTTATSDTPAVATVDVGSDDLEIFVRSVAVGSANITVTNGALSDTIAVVVVEPQATSLDVDATDAVLVPKGTTG